MNLENVCRTCLRIPKRAKNLFDDESNLLKKIETISAVVIENTVNLPKQICEECVVNINSFYSFRKVIINTDLDLRARLETLKKTNYRSKPRSKTNGCNVETESLSQNSLDIKSELDLHSQNDINVSDSEYIPEDDLPIIKALAMKKIFKCKQCKQMFNSKFKLNNHNRTEHTPPGVCNICGTVVRADNLKKHMKLHSDSPSKCGECGKVFKNSESLRTHKFLHTEHSFTCEMCGKCFKLKAEHTRHLKKHNDPDFRKVSCSVCGKKMHNLKKHMLTHTGEKPFTCDICSKSFSSRYALKIHCRQHTNEKPFICDHCGYACSQKVSLNMHLKNKHEIVA